MYIFISIHAPSRERPGTTAHVPSACNFNPRSLAGATALSHRRCLFLRISIHAPSRERRGLIQIYRRGSGISIHAPSRERPTPVVPFMDNIYIISIHAPSRERPTLASGTLDKGQFQSTLPRGSDYNQYNSLHNTNLFQSTLPRGSDAQDVLNLASCRYFNPRSLAGATF